MIWKWTLAGALIGALSALGTWLAEDEGPSSSTDPAPVESVAAPNAPELSAPSEAPTGEGARTAPATERVAVDAAPAALDDFGLVAFGRVSATDDAGVPGARLAFEDDELYRHAVPSEAGGHWTSTALAPGTYALRVEAPGFLPVDERVTVAAGAPWRHDVVLERGLDLPVRVEDPDGEAIDLDYRSRGVGRDLEVVASLERPGPDAVLDSSWRFAEGRGQLTRRRNLADPAGLDARYQGRLALDAPPPVWATLVLHGGPLDSKPLDARATELVFVVDFAALAAQAGEVRARVVDAATGALREDVQLARVPRNGVDWTRKPEVEDGVLVFRDVPPAEWCLAANRGFARVPVPPFRLGPGEVKDLGTVRIPVSKSFEVRLFGPDGEPRLEHLRAFAHDASALRFDEELAVRVRPKAGQPTTVSGVPAGPVAIVVGGRSSGVPLQGHLVDTSATDVVEVKLRGGTPVVLVRGDALPPRAWFVLENAAGVPLSSGRWLTRDVQLVPERHQVRVYDGNVELLRKDFVVGDQRLVVRIGD